MTAGVTTGVPKVGVPARLLRARAASLAGAVAALESLARAGTAASVVVLIATIMAMGMDSIGAHLLQVGTAAGAYRSLNQAGAAAAAHLVESRARVEVTSVQAAAIATIMDMVMVITAMVSIGVVHHPPPGTEAGAARLHIMDPAIGTAAGANPAGGAVAHHHQVVENLVSLEDAIARAPKARAAAAILTGMDMDIPWVVHLPGTAAGAIPAGGNPAAYHHHQLVENLASPVAPSLASTRKEVQATAARTMMVIGCG